MAPTMKSLTSEVRPLKAGAHVVHATFLAGKPVLALADGTVLRGEPGAEVSTIAHADATLLVATSDMNRLITGGDDGRVVSIAVDGSMAQIGEEKGKWIDALAAREDGALAWSAGKQVRALDPKGEVKSFIAPSTVRGLAFLPKGYRLAIAHYNGASLWFPNAAAAPDTLEWRGSHLDITISPDGKFAVSSMQENSLHGWRIIDKKNMRMTGYPAKTRSFSWSHDGQWLATSGAEACIIWPFQSKDGPMGKAPRECAVRPSQVSCVAFHPGALIVAVGYQDGWILLCRLNDAAEIAVQTPRVEDGRKAVTALAWSRDGKQLLFGAEDGFAGLLQIP